MTDLAQTSLTAEPSQDQARAPYCRRSLLLQPDPRALPDRDGVPPQMRSTSCRSSGGRRAKGEITRYRVMPSGAYGRIVVMVMDVFVIRLLAAHGGVLAARRRRPVGAEPKGRR